MKRAIVAVLFFALLTVSGAAQSILNSGDGPLSIATIAETGFVKILTHQITIGDPGAGNTTFDYVREGGQEILFPFSRYSAELGIGDRHRLIFLYQPLLIDTQVWLQEARTIDGETFVADEGVNVTYSFPFYRTSYLFDFFPQDNTELALGVSLQLRNASVRFESTGGQRIVVTQDLGLVPIIKLRGEHRFTTARIPGAFVAGEVDGFYASSAIFNGADFEFTGSIFDASIRAGYQPIDGVEVFLNVRALGGGANGTRPAEDNIFWTQSRDGFTDNFLTSLSVTLGARLR
jgi:hypothetical protein